MDKRDFYDVLGISKSATEPEIKRAYRRLAKQYHPDQNKGNKDAEERFKEVQVAYDVLSDKDKRSRYDQFGHAGIDPRAGGSWTVADGEPVDFGDFASVFDLGGAGSGGESPFGRGVFEQIFGGRGGGGPRGRGHRPGRDIDHEVSLTFDQAIRGTTLELDMNIEGSRQRIAVHVPAGVRDGQTIRARGQGQPGRGGASGDLNVVCRVQAHPYFRRLGDDIYLDVPISITEAALGAKVDLPTVDGIRSVSVPPGTPSGSRLRLAGLGAPDPRSGARGDHYAVIKIVPPARPTPEQRQLLEELKRTEPDTPRNGLWR
jgi:DnaJ-class molecular chaperone